MDISHLNLHLILKDKENIPKLRDIMIFSILGYHNLWFLPQCMWYYPLNRHFASATVSDAIAKKWPF